MKNVRQQRLLKQPHAHSSKQKKYCVTLGEVEMTSGQKPASTELRQQAEEQVLSETMRDEIPLSECEAQKLIHELRIHQIELEMQNEELRKAQYTAETAATRYNDLYEFSPTGLVSLSPDGSIRQINLAGARLLGRDRAKLEDANFNFFVAEASRPDYKDFLQQVFDSESKQSCELLLLPKFETWATAEKEPAPCTVLVEAMRSADAQECHMVLVDITARKHTEEQLKLAANVFTHAREGILITDANGTIIDVNETFTSITGYSRKEVLGHNPRFLQSGHQTPDFYATMWASLRENKKWSGELSDQRKNGEAFVEMITISAVCDASDQVQNYVALFTDINARERTQETLGDTVNNE